MEMQPLKDTPIDHDWSMKFAGSGNLDAAAVAVAARLVKGLATAEALELTRESVMPPQVAAGELIAAQVPGDVHQDLMRAGLITDPHQGLNEFTSQWIGRSAWTYATHFQVEDLQDCNELVFEGLDTIATVYLNDHKILEARDMHVDYVVDVAGILTLGGNHLVVEFVAQEDWADSKEVEVGNFPNAYSDPTNQIRKMACNYGWDWGPTLVTAGIWKPIILRQFHTRLDGLRTIPYVVAGQAKLLVAGSTVGQPFHGKLRVTQESIVVDEREVNSDFNFEINIENVELWFPRGYGEQPLYELEIELISDSGTTLDQCTRTVGYRNVEIVSEPDQWGTNFEIRINGQRIWVRGANWIPDSTSIAVVNSDNYRERIKDAQDSNMNLLRVWGGGIFEKDEFYDECDRAGILVWQDFLFACASYPEDKINSELIRAEVVSAVPRLSSHVSLAVWNGSNENIWGYFDWGWQEDLAGRPWGLNYYTELIPELLSELDPTRPYQPSSPWSGSMEIHPNDPDHGTAHLWEPWNRQDYTTYTESVPRFVTEYGYQSPAAYSTLAGALSPGELWEDSAQMRSHQKALDGKLKLRRAIDIRFPEPINFDDWHYLTQLEQARALYLGISHLRSHHEISSGSVIWQLNDCWPAISWSLIDITGQKKPAWFAVRDRYADQILAFRGSGDDLSVVAVNDSQHPWVDQLVISQHDFTGNSNIVAKIEINMKANSSVEFNCSDLFTGIVPDAQFLSAKMGESITFKFFEEDKDLTYLNPRYDLEVIPTETGIKIRITPEVFLRDVCIFVDRIDPHAEIDKNFLNLFQGQTTEFFVKSDHASAFQKADFTSIIRSAGDLFHKKA